MSAIRIFFGLLWVFWGLFWVVVGQEVLGWSFWLSLGMLSFLAIIYIFVPNWWALESGIIMFFLFWIGGGLAMWLWSYFSPIFNYEARGFGEWVSVSMLYAYIGTFLFKVGATLEAKCNPGFFNPDYLDALEENEEF